jgi:hypothetical protein
MNYTRTTTGMALALVGAFVTCTSDERAQRLEDTEALPHVDGDNMGGGGGDAPDASVEADASAAVTNCGELSCRGAGKCIVANDVPTCVCDEGYTLEEGECVVDETCIKLRLLEPGCRQYQEQEPALAMFVSVETCAGTTVLPTVLGEASAAFQVLEDGNDLGEESFATVLERDVESFVTIAIDLSTSVANNPGLLDSMISSVIGLIHDLEPDAVAGPVNVELIAFGRTVNPILAFTADFTELVTRLESIKGNPQGVVEDPEGTNLSGVVNLGIASLAAASAARRADTGGAVVSIGTLITITDGRDTAGETLLPIDPRFNVISVGVSGEIDDTELTRVGPQGSFLAPEQADRDAAFTTIAQRVAEYPKRARLIAYCSPAVAGTHTVVATLANREAAAVATCTFDAQFFGVGAGICNAAFINGYCESGEDGCGTFLACGACPTDGGAGFAAWRFPGE